MGSAKYRVAIVGAGRIGGLLEGERPPSAFRKPHSHFASYNAVDETEVVAVAGRSEGRLRMFTERYGITNLYTDYREMIEAERPDIVSVTTQSIHKAEVITFAAEHGVRGIFAEKALCTSLDEADRIRDAVNANGVAFNFGAERRHHDGFQRLREAIANGDIGEPKYAFCYWLTDLMKHHSHTIDTLAFLLGDPPPTWAEGRLVLHGDPLDDGSRKGPREGTDMHQRPLPLPTLNVEENRFVPPDGLDFADPLLDFSRVGYDGGAEAVFIPLNRATEFEIHGTEGRAFAWDDGEDIRLRRKAGGSDTQEKRFVPSGESPTVNTIRDLVNELETGERTSGNIDVTHRICEAEFGLAWSHVQGSQRIGLPVEGAGRSLHIPNH